LCFSSTLYGRVWSFVKTACKNKNQRKIKYYDHNNFAEYPAAGDLIKHGEKEHKP
jgi:hypothetical protein